MPQSNKRPANKQWIIGVVLVVVLGAVLAYLLVTGVRRTKGANQYQENFNTVTYKDATATTADWNTSLGKLRLPVAGGGGTLTKADGTTAGANDVSSETSVAGPNDSGAFALKMGSDDKPRVAWVGGGTSTVYFAKWSGTAWVKADGTPGADALYAAGGACGDPIAGERPALALGTGDNPHVFFRTSEFTTDTDLCLGDWTGGAWSFVRLGAKWAEGSAIPTNQWDQGVIAADVGGNLVAAGHDAVNDNIWVSHFNGTSWKGFADSAGPPASFRADNIRASLNLAVPGSDHIAFPALDLDAGGLPHMSLFSTDAAETTASAQFYSLKWTGSAYAGEDGSSPSTAMRTSNGQFGQNALAVNGSDVSYIFPCTTSGSFPGTPDEACYMEFQAGSFTNGFGLPGITNLSNDPGVISGVSLDAKPSSSIEIDTFSTGATGNHNVITRKKGATSFDALDGSAGGSTTIAGTGADEINPSVALTSTGTPGYTYDGGSDVFYTQFSSSPTTYQPSATGQSLNVNSSSNPVTQVTLSNVVSVPMSTDIFYSVSNDGGATWETASVGSPHTFVNPTGTDLRWKADLSTTMSMTQTPEIDQLTLDYTTAAPPGTIATCGTTIATSGTYQVTSDLNCSGTAVTVNANDVVVMGNGHTIQVPNTFFGFDLQGGKTGFDLQDINLVDGGVQIGASANGKISAVNFSGTADAGLLAASVITTGSGRGNSFDGSRGYANSGGTVNVCASTDPSSAGSFFGPSVPAAERAIGPCNDLNGDGVIDQFDPGVETSYSSRFGKDIIAENGALQRRAPAKFSSDGEFMRSSINCAKVGGLFTNWRSGRPCTPDELTLKLSHPTDPANPNAISDIAGGWNADQGGVVRKRSAILPSGSLAGASIDVLEAGTVNSATGVYQVNVIVPTDNSAYHYNLSAGKGAAEKAYAEDLETTLALPSTVAQIVCKTASGSTTIAVPSTATAANCQSLRFLDAGGNNLYGVEAASVVQGAKRNPTNGNEGFQDRKTGIANAAGNNITFNGGSAEGVTTLNADGCREAADMFAFGNARDQMCRGEAADSGSSDWNLLSVNLTASALKLKNVIPSTLDFSDIASPAGAVTPKLAVGIKISVLDNPTETWKIDNQKVVTTGLAIGGGEGRGDIDNQRVEVTNSTVSVFGHKCDTNVKNDLEQSAYLFNEHTPGAQPCRGGGVLVGSNFAKISGNKILGAGNIANVDVPAPQRTAMANDPNFVAVSTGVGIAVGDIDGHATADPAVEIKNNIITDAFFGIGAWSAKFDISGNTVKTLDDATLEQAADAAANAQYGLADDKLSADGTTFGARSLGDASAKNQGLPIGIGVGCGKRDTTIDGRSGSQAVSGDEKDLSNKPFKLWTDGHDSGGCDGIVVANNQIQGGEGAGLVLHTEMKTAGGVCGSLLPNTDSACSGAASLPSANVVVKNNTITGRGTASVDEVGLSADSKHQPTRAIPANGFDLCMGIANSSVEEIGNQTVLIQSVPFTWNGIPNLDVPNGPRYLLLGNTCGSQTPLVGAGGLGYYGTGSLFAAGNTFNAPQYRGITARCAAGTGYHKKVSDFGYENQGTKNSCTVALKGNTFRKSGQELPTCTSESVGEKQWGDGTGELCSSFGDDVSLHFDNNNLKTNTTKYYVKSNNVIGSKIGLNFADAGSTPTEATNYLNSSGTVIDITENRNPDTGNLVPIVSENKQTDAVVAAATQAGLAKAKPGIVNAKCGVRDEHDAKSPCNAKILVFDNDCAKDANKKKPLVVIANCPVIGEQDTPYNTDTKWSYYHVNVPLGSTLYAVAVSNDLHDANTQPVVSNHTKIGKITVAGGTKNVTLKMNCRDDHVCQGLTTTEEEGSALDIFEPTDVIWNGTEELYPFGFVSDSNWDVNLCLSAPEGYQVASGESCIQTLVANEEKFVNFTLKEVGSVPAPSKITYKLTTPEGQKRTVESSVGVRLTPALAKTKGVQVDELGYLPQDHVERQIVENVTPVPSTPANTQPEGVSKAAQTVNDQAKATTNRNLLIYVLAALGALIVVVLGVIVAARKGKKG